MKRLYLQTKDNEIRDLLLNLNHYKTVVVPINKRTKINNLVKKYSKNGDLMFSNGLLKLNNGVRLNARRR